MGLRLALNFRRVDPSKGGAETYVADLCRRLVERGHQVDLFAEEWARDVLPAQVWCRKVPVRGKRAAGRIRSFAENSEALLRGGSYDCTVGFINTWATDVLIPQGGVHEGSLECNARRFPEGWRRRLYLAAKRANPKARLYREIEARRYDPRRGAKVIVAVSAMVRGHLERFHGVGADRVRVIPNAIDAGRLAVDDPAAVRRDYRRCEGLGEEELVALFVGHNFRLKGLAPLLKALRLRLDRDPGARPVRLLVCGGGRIAPFARLVRRLGLGRDVRLIGFARDIRAVFHASDFFVLPTYYDPCSLVVFEALACGLPVVTTAFNGAGEVIEAGREGYVIPEPDDLDGLAGALDRLADDGRRGGMAAAARELGRAQSFDRHVDRLVGVFEEVAGWREAGVGGGSAGGSPREGGAPGAPLSPSLPHTGGGGQKASGGGGLGARATAYAPHPAASRPTSPAAGGGGDVLRSGACGAPLSPSLPHKGGGDRSELREPSSPQVTSDK